MDRHDDTAEIVKRLLRLERKVGRIDETLERFGAQMRLAHAAIRVIGRLLDPHNGHKERRIYKDVTKPERERP